MKCPVSGKKNTSNNKVQITLVPLLLQSSLRKRCWAQKERYFPMNSFDPSFRYTTSSSPTPNSSGNTKMMAGAPETRK